MTFPNIAELQIRSAEVFWCVKLKLMFFSCVLTQPCVMHLQPPSLTSKEGGAAFDSRSSSGPKVSPRLLCLLRSFSCALACDRAADPRRLTCLILQSPLCFPKTIVWKTREACRKEWILMRTVTTPLNPEVGGNIQAVMFVFMLSALSDDGSVQVILKQIDLPLPPQLLVFHTVY